MINAKAAERYKVTAALTRAIDKIFILQAGHQQNLSTSLDAIYGSSAANLVAFN